MTSAYKWQHDKTHDILQLSDSKTALIYTNRHNVFKHHICDIPEKGHVLTKTTAWWFNKIIEKGICNTHYLYSNDNIMFVKPTRSIPFYVRVNGYNKYTRLEKPIITYILKGDVDAIITPLQIIELNMASSLDLEIIYKTVLSLYTFGREETLIKGLIMVNSKYNFGFDTFGSIILIDDVHTNDSSRYFDLSNTKDPKKDIVKYWIKENLKIGSKVPQQLIKQASSSYTDFYKKLTGDDLEKYEYFGMSVNYTKLLNVLTC